MATCEEVHEFSLTLDEQEHDLILNALYSYREVMNKRPEKASKILAADCQDLIDAMVMLE